MLERNKEYCCLMVYFHVAMFGADIMYVSYYVILILERYQELYEFLKQKFTIFWGITPTILYQFNLSESW